MVAQEGRDFASVPILCLLHIACHNLDPQFELLGSHIPMAGDIPWEATRLQDLGSKFPGDATGGIPRRPHGATHGNGASGKRDDVKQKVGQAVR